jgi:hypothetical protein
MRIQDTSLLFDTKQSKFFKKKFFYGTIKKCRYPAPTDPIYGMQSHKFFPFRSGFLLVPVLGVPPTTVGTGMYTLNNVVFTKPRKQQ